MMIVEIYRIAGLLLLLALSPTTQTKERALQEDNSPVVCGNGFYEASWMQLPLNDVPGQPSIPARK
jgi:hypothetical protein